VDVAQAELKLLPQKVADAREATTVLDDELCETREFLQRFREASDGGAIDDAQDLNAKQEFLRHASDVQTKVVAQADVIVGRRWEVTDVGHGYNGELPQSLELSHVMRVCPWC